MIIIHREKWLVKRLFHKEMVEMGLSADVEKLSESLPISILRYQVAKRTFQFG